MSRLRKTLSWILLVAAILLVVIQFVGPAKSNPTIDPALSIASQMHVDPKVEAILQRSCFDCHSDHTRWPWYSNVAPVSWFVINHVNDGRRNLNFSEWGNYDQKRRARRLEQMCDMVRTGEMPLSSYTPLHPGSKLTDEDIKNLCNWAQAQHDLR
jgi:hypothetical protein